MSSPNDPQDPYSAGGQPEQPTAPGAPQYPSAPQYGAPPPAAPGGYPQAPQAPQFGAPPYAGAPQYGDVYSYPKNSLGVWSLVLGLVGLVCLGFLTGIPAIIVGNKAKKAVAAGEANNGGLATAGVIIGWVTIGLSVLGIIIAVVTIAAAGGLEAYMNEMANSSTGY
jgi:hypothetical protein